MASGPVEFRVLGPLEVVVDDRVVEIGSRKQRMLLAALAAESGCAVASDTLAELLWAGRPPVTVGVTLRGLVSRLRAALGPAANRLVARDGGYLLRTAPEEVDADRFARLLAYGRTALATERFADAVSALRDALALWRGTPLADLGDAELVRDAVSRLQEARVAAVEDLAAAEVAAGQPGDAVDRLEPHLTAHPLRERGWEQLMLALYRLGRQADALAAYRRVRRILGEELGIEPTPALRRLERRILAHDPSLDHARPGRTPARHSLPAALTPLVGRAAELAALRRRLASARLITLTGVGGVGKTRLALQLAHDVNDRFEAVRFVELAPFHADLLVEAEVARALGVGRGGPDALEAVVEHLQGRRVLLVLDNCEHVLVGAFGLVEALLRACPPLTVLATSREPLTVSGEIVVPVPPLALPPPGSGPAELASSSAVVLFCQRGRAAQAGFGLTVENAAAVEQICRRLDGIPLALELAAARLRALAASQVAARLDDRFDLLTSGGRAALPRQQTLRAAMDWSYRLLAPEEQAALHALTVFPADFDLDAAAAVVGADGDDLVFRLVDKSLVTTRAGADEMRYSLLETVRAFAAESTHPSERAAARRRHRAHFCRVVTGWPRSTWWIPAWHREVARDDGNLHAAVGSAFDDGDEVAARALLGGMWPYWTWNDRAEALEWLTRALESEGPDLAARAAVTTGLAVLLRLSGAASVERSDELFAEAVALATTAADDRCRCLAQYLRGDILLMSGDCGGARTAYREALRCDPDGRAAVFHHALGWTSVESGDAVGARQEFEEAVRSAVSGDVYLPHAQAALAVLLVGSEPDRARVLVVEAVCAARESGLRGVLVMGLVRAAQVYLRCGDDLRARTVLTELFTLLHQHGTRPFRTEALEAAALLAARSGEQGRAARCRRAADAERADERSAVDVLGPALADVCAVIDVDDSAPVVVGEVVAETRAWLES